MTVGLTLVDTATLTDIANAIRQQNGGSGLYRPGEMATAIAALDGTQAGTPRVEPYMELERGLLSSSVLDDIDAAIRAQDGAQSPYAPADMAAAILALAWDTGLKARALLLDDGTLEFNYRDGRSSDLGTVSQGWEVDASGYASDTARPWHGVRTQVRKVAFDADFALAGVTNYAYWCCGMTALEEVSGFEACSGAVDVTQMFQSCARLETIWASSFDNTAIAAATGVLYGCVRLVGGSCFVPTNTSGASALALGPAGVLTDPAGDARTWVWAHRYGDGELVITADPTPAANRVLDTSGRLCANAHYNAVGCAPWYEARAGMRYCELDASLRGLALESMDYWFYSNTDLALVYGWENVAGLASMRMTFNGCTALGALYLTGLDPSGLRDLFYTFALCTMLEAIYVDATWALPAACTGMATFYNCTRLKGGNGTAYSSAATGASMAVIDGAGSPGYLTGA